MEPMRTPLYVFYSRRHNEHCNRIGKLNHSCIWKDRNNEVGICLISKNNEGSDVDCWGDIQLIGVIEWWHPTLERFVVRNIQAQEQQEEALRRTKRMNELVYEAHCISGSQ